MPYTRQRPDGTNETKSPTLKSAVTPSPQTRYIHTNPLAVSSLIIAAAAAVLSFSAHPAEAKPAKARTTQLTGAYGWTSGSQTYLRARPSAKTPPVAKVATHTKLFVWGKFDGWYRVETPDHVFGWVYHSYLNIPNSGEIKELSHAKAKQASDRTGHQTMYGSKELLSKYYARYGASGAAKGLEKHGVAIAAAKKPGKATRVAQAKPAAKRIASAPKAPTLVTLTDPSFNDVGNVHIAPSAPRAKRDDRWGSRSNDFPPKLPNAEQPALTDTPADSPRSEDTGSDFSVPAQANPVAATTVADRDQQTREAKKIEAARLAAVKKEAARREAADRAAKARLAQENARKEAAAKAARLAEARKTENAKQSARQKRLAQQREQIRRSMGTSPNAAPPVAGAELPPLSPEELMRARNAFLAGQSAEGAAIKPSALDETTNLSARGITIPVPATLPAKPVTPVVIQVAAAKPAAKPSTKPAAKSTPPSRGGSPRDYAAYAQKQNKNFGEGLANSALAYRGMPYIYGASNPRRGFDCSGLVNYVLRQRGYNPPRTAAGLASFGKPVGKGDLQPGDILLFGNTYRRGISHVGIYMGNGKMIHAANPSRGVRVDSINSGYYANKYAGARRVK